LSDITTLQERRALNIAIENSYITINELSSRITTHYNIGTAAYGTIDDLYVAFYCELSNIIEHTAELEEMKGSTDVIAKVRAWIDKAKPNDLKVHCEEGKSLWRSYKVALNSGGLITLPSRGR